MIIALQSFSQKNKIDSLHQIINTSKNDTLKIILTNSLAWKYFQNNEKEKAKRLVLENIKTAKNQKWQQGLGYSYETIGDFYYEQQKQDSSIYFTKLAAISYENANNINKAAYENWVLGYRLMVQTKFPVAKKHFIKSLDFAKKSKNRKYELQTLSSLAWLYHEMGNYVESNQHFSLALKIAKELNDEENIGNINGGFASNFIATNNYKAAQEKYFELSDYFKKRNNLEKYASNLAIGANLYRRLNQSEKIESPLLEAYKIQKQINDKWSLITTARYLGMLYSDQKKFSLAETFLTESLKLSKGYNYNSDIIKAYYTLERMYFLKNDVANGDKYQKLVIRMRDSLYTAENNKALAEFDVKYKTAEKEAKLAESQLEIAQKQNWIIGLSVSFWALLSLGLMYWKIQTGKQREILQNIEIENTRKVLNVREIERQRIAKELHDSVGSQLTIVSTSLDNAFFLAENQKLIPQKLETINLDVRAAAQSLRDTIWAIHNTEIPISNLYARMQHYLTKVLGESNTIEYFSSFKGDDKQLNSIEALNFFRIFQEAIQNIQKHSAATIVNLLFSNIENNTNLTISDNGKGFEINNKILHENFGLSNMKQRSEEISATLKISSELGKGTIIEVNLEMELS